MNIAQIKVLLKAEKFEEALQGIDAALEKCPENAGLWKWRGNVIQLLDIENHPPLSEVERSYLKALELDAHNLETIESLAHLYDCVVPDPERAKQYARQYVEIAERSVRAMKKIISDEI